ncbi:glycosyl transferase family protein [Qipengyuania sp. DSG2-2]|uniref:glycosyl transferase family protein n=1 Tax=Qipengyuania sp. DGS2-2 TaxID=3349631 RepID=UPI0036D26B03
MELAGFTAEQWLVLVQHELLLFTGLMFLAGAVDEWAVDLLWLYYRATGRTKTARLPDQFASSTPLRRQAAVFIPTWAEAPVIGMTIRHILRVWPQDGLRIYVGCYPNDPDTMSAVIEAAGGDPRVKLVIADEPGPTTKAGCLNRLYRALRDDEQRGHARIGTIILHDAEDLVDQSALTLIDAAMQTADFVQLPVLPAPQPASRWIGSHYCEEFAEQHGKAMLVRDTIGASIPSAGVGCAVDRGWLDRVARRNASGMPFAADSLTEDYELGLTLDELGAQSRFLRARGADGHLVATRACFPSDLTDAVRQKTRWVNGIALHGWDRTGWSARPLEIWMRLRDRRGPLTAFVLALAYALLFFAGGLQIAHWLGWGEPFQLTPALRAVLLANAFALAWRAAWRFAFTAREYGALEGARAVLRIPLANVIAIMAGRRALVAYWRALRGAQVTWDKTSHSAHPVLDAQGRFVKVAV